METPNILSLVSRDENGYFDFSSFLAIENKRRILNDQKHILSLAEMSNNIPTKRVMENIEIATGQKSFISQAGKSGYVKVHPILFYNLLIKNGSYDYILENPAVIEELNSIKIGDNKNDDKFFVLFGKIKQKAVNQIKFIEFFDKLKELIIEESNTEQDIQDLCDEVDKISNFIGQLEIAASLAISQKGKNKRSISELKEILS
jgi:hypothetical protein